MLHVCQTEKFLFLRCCFSFMLKNGCGGGRCEKAKCNLLFHNSVLFSATTCNFLGVHLSTCPMHVIFWLLLATLPKLSLILYETWWITKHNHLNYVFLLLVVIAFGQCFYMFSRCLGFNKNALKNKLLIPPCWTNTHTSLPPPPSTDPGRHVQNCLVAQGHSALFVFTFILLIRVSVDGSQGE